MLHRVFDKSSSVPVIKNNNNESPWFWDMKMSGNTVMYWYLKNCVWFIKFHDKFEKLQDIKTISWVFLQNKKLTQCKRWHQITLFKTACLFLFFIKWKSCIFYQSHHLINCQYLNCIPCCILSSIRSETNIHNLSALMIRFESNTCTCSS